MQVFRALSAPLQERHLCGTGHLEYRRSHVAIRVKYRPRWIGAEAEKPSKPVDLVLPPAPDLGQRKADQSWNASSLAFLGDSVWEVRGLGLEWVCCRHRSLMRVFHHNAAICQAATF